jgi:hypothetical protein
VLRTSALAVLLGCLGLIAAGCGGAKPPSVASLGSTTTSSSTPTSSSSLTPQQETAIDVAYAACLSEHGVQVEALSGGGLVWVTSPGSPGPGSPQAAAAERDCKSPLPKGGLPPPTTAQNARNLAQMLRWAKCMRAHGATNVPDPTSQGERMSPSIGNSPQFKSAEKSCQHLTLGVVP